MQDEGLPNGDAQDGEGQEPSADLPTDLRLRDLVWFPAMVCGLALVCAVLASVILLVLA